MTLPRQRQQHALALLERSGSLEREYFRSVELSYAHPDDVISGEGARLYGGRFVRPGVAAIYGSTDEYTAIREAAARRERLAGGPGIPIANYPRITYVVAVKLAIHIDLTLTDDDVLAVLPACLDRDLADSQEIGECWRQHGVQGILYPCAVPGLNGSNVVVFRDVAPEPEIVLVNREQIIEELRRLSSRPRS
ncbi:MAG: RES family NAD+ phosphorylase [Acidobacteria bacterium]|nr:RES family NAD+ phosphorylase [Acidobacteriota bacterium]